MTIQPHPEYERLLKAFGRLVAERSWAAWSGDVFRSTTPKYASSRDLVSGFGSKMNGGRWNAVGSFPVVYASIIPEDAFAEALASYRRFGIQLTKAMPRIVTAIRVELSRVIDLNNGRVRRSLHVSSDRMQADPWWVMQSQQRESLTQAIGRAAREQRIEAIMVPSAEVRGSVNLAIFPDRLAKTSRLAVLDGE